MKKIIWLKYNLIQLKGNYLILVKSQCFLIKKIYLLVCEYKKVGIESNHSDRFLFNTSCSNNNFNYPSAWVKMTLMHCAHIELRESAPCNNRLICVS